MAKAKQQKQQVKYCMIIGGLEGLGAPLISPPNSHLIGGPESEEEKKYCGSKVYWASRTARHPYSQTMGTTDRQTTDRQQRDKHSCRGLSSGWPNNIKCHKKLMHRGLGH